MPYTKHLNSKPARMRYEAAACAVRRQKLQKWNLSWRAKGQTLAIVKKWEWSITFNPNMSFFSRRAGQHLVTPVSFRFLLLIQDPARVPEASAFCGIWRKWLNLFFLRFCFHLLRTKKLLRKQSILCNLLVFFWYIFFPLWMWHIDCSTCVLFLTNGKKFSFSLITVYAFRVN